jgi:hypothetical protein
MKNTLALSAAAIGALGLAVVASLGSFSIPPLVNECVMLNSAWISFAS